MSQSDEPSDCLKISDSQNSLPIKNTHSRVLEQLNLCKIACGDTHVEKLDT